MAKHRRRDGRWKGNAKKPPRASFPRDQVSQCPFCGQTVRDVLTAIATSADNQPAHFDCVLRRIGEQEDLRPREKVVYLGNGCFGIVRFRNGNDLRQFTIRKRIQFEDAEGIVAWRSTVSQRPDSD